MNTARLLIVDDDDVDRQTLVRAAAASGLSVEVIEARSAVDGIAQITSGACDCVILDYWLPGMNGLEMLAELQRRDLSIPVIALTAQGDEGLAVELMKAGATDYLNKQTLTPDRLERSVRHALAVADLARLKAELLAREQRARRDAEAENAAKDQFLAMLSHELRTPLNVILGWARLLTSQSLDGPVRARAYQAIEHNASALARHIDDLLDISRIVAGTLSLSLVPTDVRSAFAAALESMRPAAAAKDIDLTFEQSGPDRLITVDPARLNQILMNLVSNALKFTPPKGRVVVRVTFAPEAFLLEVQDSGVGIAPEFLPHVFSRFRQADPSASRRHGGLGLGLSIVQQLAQLHGGTVAVDSEGIGHGATFRVRLPTDGVDLSPAPAARPTTGQRLVDVRVLMVDDQADARELVTILLQLEGAQVRSASSAASARTELARQQFDVIVSDISMPEEDGYAFIQALRRHERARGAPRMPAVALTALARAVDRDQVLRTGFDAYLAKPVDADSLVATIATLAGAERHDANLRLPDLRSGH